MCGKMDCVRGDVKGAKQERREITVDKNVEAVAEDNGGTKKMSLSRNPPITGPGVTTGIGRAS